MTSEILITTPSAIVLAADSAVTVNDRKTYTGANKLFMLSNNPSMGTMIYNNSYFSNLPLETIIGDFSQKNKDNNELQSVAGFKNEFKKYLKNLLTDPSYIFSFEDRLNNFIAYIKYNKNDIEDIIENLIEDVPNDWDYDIFEENCETIINHLNDNKEKFLELIPNSFDESEKETILKDMQRFFIHNEFLNSYTGIIIAGYDDDKLFPAHTEFHISYLFDDKFMFTEIEEIYDSNNVRIKTFAQKEVIDTFLGSIDPNTQNEIVNYMNDFYKFQNEFLKENIITNDNLTDCEKKKFIAEISKFEEMNEMMNFSFNEFIEDLKNEHIEPIFTSIASLPKEELSELAESLIKLTSLKMKVEPYLESVGGYVDVAIITKEDGFIWTKKKNYFTSDLNPHHL